MSGLFRQTELLEQNKLVKFKIKTKIKCKVCEIRFFVQGMIYFKNTSVHQICVLMISG